MTKNDAINIIAKKSNSSITDVARIINEYQNIIMEVVASGDSVNFVGFGSYEPLSKNQEKLEIHKLVKRFMSKRQLYQNLNQGKLSEIKSLRLTNSRFSTLC